MSVSKHIAPIALSVGLLGLVGGVAAAQAFKPADKPQRVEFVRPAAETVTPEPTVTVTPTETATVAPKPVAPKKVAPAPVESEQAPAPAPAPVQRQAVVSEPAPEPAPEPVITTGPQVKQRPGQKPGNQLPDPPPTK